MRPSPSVSLFSLSRFQMHLLGERAHVAAAASVTLFSSWRKSKKKKKKIQGEGKSIGRGCSLAPGRRSLWLFGFPSSSSSSSPNRARSRDKLGTFGHPACARCRDDTILRSRSTASTPQSVRKAFESRSWLAFSSFSMLNRWCAEALLAFPISCLFVVRRCHRSRACGCPRASKTSPTEPNYLQRGESRQQRGAMSENDRASLVGQRKQRLGAQRYRPLEKHQNSLSSLSSFLSPNANSPRSLPPWLTN